MKLPPWLSGGSVQELSGGSGQELQEEQLQSLCQEDPLEKGMETHSTVLAWRIPWIEDPGRLQSIGS